MTISRGLYACAVLEEYLVLVLEVGDARIDLRNDMDQTWCRALLMGEIIEGWFYNSHMRKVDL